MVHTLFSNYLKASGLPLSPIQIRTVKRPKLSSELYPTSYWNLWQSTDTNYSRQALAWGGHSTQVSRPGEYSQGASTFLASPSTLHPFAKSCQWVQIYPLPASCSKSGLLSMEGQHQAPAPPGLWRRYHASPHPLPSHHRGSSSRGPLPTSLALAPRPSLALTTPHPLPLRPSSL